MIEEFNSGYLSIDKKPQDWSIGGQGDFFSPLNSRQLITSNDWSQFLPVVEFQNSGGFDRMACVSYSDLNTFEILHLFHTGKEANFSDRYLAKMSGTTKQGNDVARVFDTAREYGLVGERMWEDVSTGWDDYYKEIPSEIIKEGKSFISGWDIYREYVPTIDKNKIFESLNYAPLQVIVKYASGEGLLSPEGKYNHAVMCYGAVYGEYWKIFDHYSQTTKKYSWNYEFGCIVKPTFEPKKNDMLKPKNGYLYLLVEGQEQKMGMGLDGKLVMYDQKIDTLINSSSRLKRFEPAIPVTMKDWSSVQKVDGKGNEIK